MSEFWHSVQKARREHFCYFCCNYIEPGQIYSRKIWAPRPGSFHVMNEHQEPRCPPNIGERMIKEMAQAERAELGVPIVLAIQMQEKVVIERNGATHLVCEPVLVPTLVEPTDAAEEFSDEEIAF